MPYPKWLRKLNNFLGKVGGCLCFVVAIMFLTEMIMRYVFRHPTSFMTDYACYLHCLALFLGCAFTYQVHGHVGVDMFRSMVDKKTKGAKNHLGTRVMAIIGYCQTLFFLAITTVMVFRQVMNTYSFGSKTASTYPIPQCVLYGIIFGGCVLMLITVFCIILTLFGKDNEYIE